MEQTNSWNVETGGAIFDYPGPGKSPAWTYFGFHKSIDGSLDKNRAVCKICQSYVKNCGNTSNLRAHLSSHHGLVFSASKTETMHFSNITLNNDQYTPSEFPKMTRFSSTTANEHDMNGETYKRPENFDNLCKEMHSSSDPTSTSTSTSKSEVVFDIAASLAQCQTLKFERDPKEIRKSNQTYDSSKQIFDNPSNFKSPVWNYFGFHMSENGSLNRSETVCKLCFVKIKYCNTTNLRNHLTKHHGIQFPSESPNSNVDREYFPGGNSYTNTTSKSAELESFISATNFSPKISCVMSEEKSVDEISRPIFENPVKFKSPVWSYFGFHMSDDGILDKTKAICRLCSGTVKFSGNTTNLRVHLANHHDINVGNAEKGSNRGSLESSSWSQESNSSFSESTDNQNEVDKPETDARQHTTNKKIWNNFNFSITDDGSIDKAPATCRICHEPVAFEGVTDKLRLHLNKHFISSTPNNKTSPPLSHQEDILLENSSSDSLADVTEVELDDITDSSNLYEYPGKTKSAVWKDFGFQMSEDGSLDKTKAVCRLCHKAIKFCGNTTNLQFHLTKHHRKVTEAALGHNIMQIEEMFSNAERHPLDNSCEPSPDGSMEPKSDLRARQIFEYPGKFKSSVWKDFGFYMSDDGTLDKSRAVCRLCLTAIKYCGNTTNLHSHLTKHHGYIAVIGETVVRRNEHDNDLLNRSQIMPFNVNHVQNLNMAIIEFLIGTLSPISIVETSAFKNLMTIMDPTYSLPSCHYISDTLISEIYASSSSRLQEILDYSEAIAITTDFWKSISEKCHMTVSANIITDSWKQENFVLQTCELDCEYTAETILNELQKVAAKWKLRGSPILISGSPSHMKEVGAKLEWLNLSCFGHTINFSAKSGLELPQVVKIVGSVRKIYTFFKQNQTAKTILQEKRSLLQLSDTELIGDDRSHWKSTYNMIDRLVEQNVAISAALAEQDLKKHSSMYDSILQTQAEEIIAVFKPLKTAATLICEQKLPIASMILPILRKLEMMLISMEDDTSLARDTRLTIWENLFQPYKETEIRDFLLITSLLDPRYKDLRFVDPPEREHAKNVLQTIAISMHQKEQWKNGIKEEINHLTDSVEESPSSASSTSQDTEQPLKKKIKLEKGLEPNEPEQLGTDDWLADVVSEKDGSAKVSKTPVTLEVDRYLSEMQTTVGPLQWWKDRQLIYPHLSRIAKKYLCVPVTAVPSERIFNNVPENVSSQRAVLPAQNVDKMIFLHCNYEKLKK